MDTNEIRKQIVLKAPRERVWNAIAESGAFGTWFGVEIDGPFVAGREAVGKIVPTKVDAEVAKLQEPYRGTVFRIRIVQIDPMHLFSFRWHPFAVDPTKDYESEPMTLVSFELADVEGGTRLTITETGFDQLPIDRRRAALEANDGGWEHQAQLVAKYLASAGERPAP
ncbi:SRPBCC family protein [Mesorhizobium sp. BR1-1-16]|uniref:SRPBCC family protein n=1 Tax=Mesorhizobium sp. BR1-1-16 TaxID=2876653 RepID=UPI001CCC3718|nr:SRPBCC family protein [Mesorhizobium sp. BR1-1-16]MBZ9936564.1 SRPBCC family protein [Mesorhizobium sp. BR1-1-16]